MTVLAVLAIATLTGCSGLVDRGPTNQEIKDTTGLTVDEATPIVERNLELVWPEQVTVKRAQLPYSGLGCRTNDEMMSDGPPWHIRVTLEEVNPSQEFIDRAVANLEAMTTRGFTLKPNQRPDADPADRFYRDSRGYTVSSSLDIADGPKKEVRFSMTATSPCAAE
ncbi:hypothetical protein ACFWUP_23365 [Nocardia sp. NPDC058658]|uniref:hypothetical protein n=1 Tax=Nocardia sp. NPDC058658 TaxID=3346580 RepID=UPI0036681F29